jgi:hypothetical protein
MSKPWTLFILMNTQRDGLAFCEWWSQSLRIAETRISSVIPWTVSIIGIAQPGECSVCYRHTGPVNCRCKAPLGEMSDRIEQSSSRQHQDVVRSFWPQPTVQNRKAAKVSSHSTTTHAFHKTCSGRECCSPHSALLLSVLNLVCFTGKCGSPETTCHSRSTRRNGRGYQMSSRNGSIRILWERM